MIPSIRVGLRQPQTNHGDKTDEVEDIHGVVAAKT